MKKTAKRKNVIMGSLILIVIAGGILTACDAKPVVNKETAQETGADKQLFAENCWIAKLYRSIYEDGAKNATLGEIETRKQIIERLGKEGYVATDYENQVNMVNYEQVEQFCKKAKAQDNANVTIMAVTEEGGFTRFDLEAAQGELQVTSSSLAWEKRGPKSENKMTYPAHTWQYTENGYLFFEKYRPKGYDGAPSQTALRVIPLPEECREANRKYILPIGYGQNQMFISDWSELDYGELDFYDLFEPLYEMKYNQLCPYGEKDTEGQSHEAPQQEFEAAFTEHFQIDVQTLRQKTVYHAEQETYQYTPRGLSNLGGGGVCPYPEVTGYEQQEDGTLKLTVQAVWPWKMTDQVITSEVIIRPLEENRWQYVSNHVMWRNPEIPADWYVERE